MVRQNHSDDATTTTRPHTPEKTLSCEDCGAELTLTVNHRLNYAECECGGDMTPVEEVEN